MNWCSTENAIVGIDLADRKMVVVCDHDSRVPGAADVPLPAWDLGVAMDWAAQRAAAKGFVRVTVACEPTGHRWRVLGQLAGDQVAVYARGERICSSRCRVWYSRRNASCTTSSAAVLGCGR